VLDVRDLGIEGPGPRLPVLWFYYMKKKNIYSAWFGARV